MSRIKCPDHETCQAIMAISYRKDTGDSRDLPRLCRPTLNLCRQHLFYLRKRWTSAILDEATVCGCVRSGAAKRGVATPYLLESKITERLGPRLSPGESQQAYGFESSGVGSPSVDGHRPSSAVWRIGSR